MLNWNGTKYMTNFIERLKTEREELACKNKKLEAFLRSEACKELEPQAQFLLAAQLGAMTTYVMILEARLTLLETAS